MSPAWLWGVAEVLTGLGACLGGLGGLLFALALPSIIRGEVERAREDGGRP